MKGRRRFEVGLCGWKGMRVHILAFRSYYTRGRERVRLIRAEGVNTLEQVALSFVDCEKSIME